MSLLNFYTIKINIVIIKSEALSLLTLISAGRSIIPVIVIYSLAPIDDARQFFPNNLSSNNSPPPI